MPHKKQSKTVKKGLTIQHSENVKVETEIKKEVKREI